MIFTTCDLLFTIYQDIGVVQNKQQINKNITQYLEWKVEIVAAVDIFILLQY